MRVEKPKDTTREKCREEGCRQPFRFKSEIKDTTGEKNWNEGCRPRHLVQKKMRDTTSEESWSEGCRACKRLGLQNEHKWWECKIARHAYEKYKLAKAKWFKESASESSRSNGRSVTPKKAESLDSEKSESSFSEKRGG